MTQVLRTALERPMQIHQAKCILNKFFQDYEAYPNEDFLMRKGICKILADEFHPLVRLAQSFWGVRSIRLLSQSNPGPDAIISFWWRQASKIQITCAHEDYNRALEREYLHYKGNTLLHRNWERDKVTGQVVANGGRVFESSVDIQVRVNRILKAIADKETKYYSGTDILLVHESPAGFQYLQEGHLHEQVRERVLMEGSHYRQIYVNYGDHVKQIK